MPPVDCRGICCPVVSIAPVKKAWRHDKRLGAVWRLNSCTSMSKNATRCDPVNRRRHSTNPTINSTVLPPVIDDMPANKDDQNWSESRVLVYCAENSGAGDIIRDGTYRMRDVFDGHTMLAAPVSSAS